MSSSPAHGQPGADERARRIVDGAHANRLARAPRAAAERGGEQLAGGGVDRRRRRRALRRPARRSTRRTRESRGGSWSCRRAGRRRTPVRASALQVRAILPRRRASRRRWRPAIVSAIAASAAAIDLADEVVAALRLPHERGAALGSLADHVGAACRGGHAGGEQRARIGAAAGERAARSLRRV